MMVDVPRTTLLRALVMDKPGVTVAAYLAANKLVLVVVWPAADGSLGAT